MPRGPSTRPPAILLVDDHPANLMALRAILDPLGCDLVDARSGREALQQIQSQDFAVVLMDVQMPQLDGLETASLIKSRLGSPLVPIIFITALDRDATHASRGYERGAVDYLFKPIDPQILRSKVTVFVELHRQREQIQLQAEQLHAERLARAQAQAEIRAREDILSIVSHDLGNPITAVGTYAEILRKFGSTTGNEKVERLAQRQLTAIERMNRLVNDLLDASRIEGGRLSLDKQFTDVADIVAHVVEIMGPSAARKSQRLESVKARGSVVHCDRDRLYQVLSNLVNNAIKFTPEKGTITIAAEAAPTELVLCVRDEGPGIAENDLPHIFDRYWQASGPNRRGLGLGLAIAKGIVLAHGGRIWVDSQPGNGAAFFIALPYA
jgi:two-component system, sensor histidine kinase